MEFSEFFTKNKIFNSKVDLIICDHTLAEVRRECLRYIAFLSKDLLNINNYAPIFLVRTFGAFINSNYWEILKIFNKAGFINIQFSNFLIFVPNNSNLAKDLGLINFFPKNSNPSSLKSNFYQLLNRLYQFQVLKLKNKSLYALKNFDNKNLKIIILHI